MPTAGGQDRAHGPGTQSCPRAGGRCRARVPDAGTVLGCRGTAPCPPNPVGPPLTLVLVLDGEAEDVPGAEAGAVVHPPVEERVGVRVLDVEDLAGGGHVPGDALVRRDADLVALWVGSWGAGGDQQQDPKTLPPQTKPSILFSPRSPHRPPRRHQTPWPPARG